MQNHFCNSEEKLIERVRCWGVGVVQRIELHKNKILELAIKKNMVGPNPLRVLRRNPNPRMGKS